MKKRSGFTLIELLIVLVIMVLIAVGVVFNLGGFNTKQNLELALNSLTAVVRDTQQRSVTQQDGETWGMRFYNTDSDRYEVFKGTSYDSGTLDKFYVFRQGIGFGQPSTSSTVDVIFNALNGKSANNQVISLVTNKGEGLIGDVIIGQSGLVTNRIEKDLVGYWHFDEGTSAIAYDASGLNNHSSLIGSPTWWEASSCRGGRCLKFNTTSDYVSVPHSSSLSNKVFGTATVFTLAAWVYPTSWVNYSTVMNKATGASWSNTTAGLWSISTGLRCIMGSNVSGNPAGSYIGPTYQPSLNNWHHVVCLADGVNLKIYVDGVYRGGAAISGLTYPRSENTAPLVFGRRSVGSIENFPGSIDEIRVYSRALSEEEILNIYNDLK